MTAIATVKKFLKAFEDLDPDALEELIADDAVNYITNATGAADRVVGAKAYADRFRAMLHKEGIEIQLNPPQMIEVNSGQVLVLVGVQVVKDGEEIFHNIGGFLINVNSEGKITESWMVDARPEESDTFWKS